MKPLLVAAILFVGPALATAAEPLAVGDRLTPISLEDQHGEMRAVDETTRLIFFSREMEGGDILKAALADTTAESFEKRGAVYVADISGMPALISRLFAIPNMRKRPYPMLLDRDGSATAQLPDVEGRATLIFLDQLVIGRVEHVESQAEVLRALEQ